MVSSFINVKIWSPQLAPRGRENTYCCFYVCVCLSQHSQGARSKASGCPALKQQPHSGLSGKSPHAVLPSSAGCGRPWASAPFASITCSVYWALPLLALCPPPSLHSSKRRKTST